MFVKPKEVRLEVKPALLFQQPARKQRRPFYKRTVNHMLVALRNYHSCPNGAATWSPGLPPRLPWGKGTIESYGNAGCAVFVGGGPMQWRNRVAVENYSLAPPTQRSRSGNVGLEGVAPLDCLPSAWSQAHSVNWF